MIEPTSVLEAQVASNLRFLRNRTFKERRNKLNKLVMKRINQAEIGNYLNISFQQVQKFENNVNKLSACQLYKLSKYFGVPMEYFFNTQLIEQQSFTKILKEIDAKPQPHNI